VFSLGSASRQLRGVRSSVQPASNENASDRLARTIPAVQFVSSRGTFCKSVTSDRNRSAKTLVGTSQINSLASSDFTEPHAPSSKPQWRAILSAVFQAATPSANLNYSRPVIAINRRPVTSRAPLQVLHNASCVFTERANKSAYHLHTNINCGDTAPTTSLGLEFEALHYKFLILQSLVLYGDYSLILENMII
jgi:hypothetical protein